jgi:hypothetical protein
MLSDTHRPTAPEIVGVLLLVGAVVGWRWLFNFVGDGDLSTIVALSLLSGATVEDKRALASTVLASTVLAPSATPESELLSRFSVLTAA